MNGCEPIEERKLFTYEERKAILKSTGGKCACCGKKLTTKTMTVEHIIPISRGGTNDIENLTALCYDDNQMKNNLLYIPMGFYTALIGTPQLIKMNQKMIEWFRGIKETFDIERFPLIAPRTNFIVTPENSYHKMRFARNLLFTWAHIGKEYYDEIEAVTNISIKDTRNLMKQFRHTDDFTPAALYSLRKITTDKILMVACISYNKEKKDMIIYIPWYDMSNKQLSGIVYNLIQNLLEAIITIAEYEVDKYAIISEHERVFDRFNSRYMPRFMGYKRKDVECTNKEDGTKYQKIVISRATDVDDMIEEFKKNMSKMGEQYEQTKKETATTPVCQ